jgi:hypothetical protein
MDEIKLMLRAVWMMIWGKNIRLVARSKSIKNGWIIPRKVLRITSRENFTSALAREIFGLAASRPTTNSRLDLFIIDPPLRELPFVLVEIANLYQRGPYL